MNTNRHWLETPEIPLSALQITIAYAGTDFEELLRTEIPDSYFIKQYTSVNHLHHNLQKESLLDLPDVIVMEVDEHEECFKCIEAIKNDTHLQGLIIILLSAQHNPEWKQRAIKLKIHDYYEYPFSIIQLHERLKTSIKLRILHAVGTSSVLLHTEKQFVYRMPVGKRLFDIVCSSMALLFLSPLLIVIGVIIKLESRGPVIYRSRRVGTGYRTFDFYKFRSMQADADVKVAEFENLNLYSQNGEQQSIFFKLVDDPRVTRFGQFLRNTSIDELPQLINILIGDMSFVGNRPLPLYEAERLTSNEWSMRFLGPAGLTGLWQITKRGRKDVSEQERKELDNFYARSCSFWLDLKILVKTLPALIQKEKV